MKLLLLPLIAAFVGCGELPEQAMVDEVKTCTNQNLSAVVHVMGGRPVAVYCLDDYNGQALCDQYNSCDGESNMIDLIKPIRKGDVQP